MVLVWVLFGFGILFVFFLIIGKMAENEKLSKMTEEEKRQYYAAQKEMADKQKYNNYMYTCPMCGSKKIKNISTSNRGLSVAMFGASSGKLGKCYECDDCKYKW